MGTGKKLIFVFCMMSVLALPLSLTGCWGGRETQTADEAEESRVESVEEPPERDTELVATACITSMSMRKNPGLDGEILETLTTGMKLEWLGQTETSGNLDFYLVRNPGSGAEGYCSANYCIPLQYELKTEPMSIVQTDDAIYSYEMMCEDLTEFQAAYPEILTVSDLGQTAENRVIWQVIVGEPDASKALFIQAGIHGREYMTSQLVMRMIEYYAASFYDAWYKDQWYRDLFQDVALYIVPMSNPDGVSISQFGENAVQNGESIMKMREAYERDKKTLILLEDGYGTPYWYDAYQWNDFVRDEKVYGDIISYEEYLRIWKANSRGVDINRNFDAGWELVNQKDAPGASFYKGDHAVSEAETQILEKAAGQRDFMGIISYHARGKLIYYDTPGIDQEVAERSQRMAKETAELTKYIPVSGVTNESVELGGFSDWAMIKGNTPAITIEIGKSACPLPIEEFEAVFVRNHELWAKFAWLYGKEP